MEFNDLAAQLAFEVRNITLILRRLIGFVRGPGDQEYDIKSHTGDPFWDRRNPNPVVDPNLVNSNEIWCSQQTYASDKSAALGTTIQRAAATHFTGNLYLLLADSTCPDSNFSSVDDEALNTTDDALSSHIYKLADWIIICFSFLLMDDCWMQLV